MEPLLDKTGLARVLNVPVSWVTKAITARSIPITWVGRYARFSQDDVDAILAKGKEPSAEAPTLSLVGHHPPAGPHSPRPPAGPRIPSKGRRTA